MTEHTDPRDLGGSIAGPGGPHDRGGVVVDARKAIIVDGSEVAIVDAVRGGEPAEQIIALNILGRLNKTTDRVSVMAFLNEDGAAGLVTELVAVASRAGFGPEFARRVKERWEAMPR